VYSTAQRNWKDGPNFDELLRIFVELFDEFGSLYWGFTAARNIPFKPRAELIPVLESLVSLGYAKAADDGYVWSEKIAQIMIATAHWRDPQNGN
jgi:hypothetical protein